MGDRRILAGVNLDDVRAYARRRWEMVAALKHEHWARERAARGPAATFEVSQALWAHVRQLHPDWPSVEERRADLAHHVALKRAIDRAAGVFHSSARR
jgi:hypothetical protein